MKILVTILLIFFTGSVFAQVTFTVDNISADYYGKIQYNDTTEVFSKGWVAIYERRTNKQIIKVVADELALELHDGKALANIKSMPYGEQSLVIYEDVNFDGRKDFAICDGQNSCYHGPSFNIYLATEKGFVFNKDFTRLAQEYCGMFNVDAKTKKLSTMTKSGCCWHQFSEFIVVNNKPKAIFIESEEMEMPFVTYTTETWNGKAMVKKERRTMDIGEADVMLSFTIPKNGKQVVLFNMNDRMMYALVQKDSTVEFSYPIEADYKGHDFKFENTAGNAAVSFKNKNAAYTIYEKPKEVGITIIADGKTYNWTGDPATKKGSLEKLKKVKLDNIY